MHHVTFSSSTLEQDSVKPLSQSRFYRISIYTLIAFSVTVGPAAQIASAQNSSENAPERSVAAVVSPPLTVSPAHSPAHRSATTAKKTYSKKSLQSQAQKSYPATHLAKGLYFKEKNDPNDALLEFLKATQENPRLVRGFYEQALIFRSRGYRKLAESSLEQALASKPDYTEARVLLATVRLEQGNLGGAVQELSRTLGLDSTDTKNAHDAKNSQELLATATGALVASASASTVPKPAPSSSGLLSFDIPAILQSIHGAIKAPFSNSGGTDTSVDTTDIAKLIGLDKEPGAKSTTTTTKTEAKSVDAVIQENQEVTNGSKRKKKKSKQKKEKKRDDSLKPSDSDKDASDEKKPKRKNKNKEATKKEIEKALKEASNQATQDRKEKNLFSRIKDGMQNLQASAESLYEEHIHDDHKAAAVSAVATSVPVQTDSRAREQVESAIAKAGARDGIPESLSKIVGTPSNSSTAPSTVTSGASRGTNSVSAEALLSSAQPPADSAMTSATSAPPVFGKSTTFSAPARSVAPSGILGGILATTPSAASSAPKALAPPAVKLDDDEWAKKLKYYVDHGANSLKNGEAFMFAEDTGEASIFLADGTTVRRIVAQPQDAQEVMRERRPDITASQDMLYGLSLLGKLIPHMDDRKVPNTVPQIQQPLGNFRGDNLMSGTQSFFGWLKSVWKF